MFVIICKAQFLEMEMGLSQLGSKIANISQEVAFSGFDDKGRTAFQWGGTISAMFVSFLGLIDQTRDRECMFRAVNLSHSTHSNNPHIGRSKQTIYYVVDRYIPVFFAKYQLLLKESSY